MDTRVDISPPDLCAVYALNVGERKRGKVYLPCKSEDERIQGSDEPRCRRLFQTQSDYSTSAWLPTNQGEIDLDVDLNSLVTIENQTFVFESHLLRRTNLLATLPLQ